MAGYWLVTLSTASAQQPDMQSCRQIGKPDAAIAACTHIIDAKPANAAELVEAYLLRAAANRNKRTFEAGLADADAALKLNPNFADGYVVRGQLEMAVKQPAKAVQDFTAALRLNPDHVIARSERAGAYTVQRNPAAAISDLDAIIRTDPRAAPAYYQRGLAQGLSGHPDKAFADFQKAVQLQPENPIWLTALGDAYARGLGVAKDQERGVQLLKKAAQTGFPPAKEMLAKLGQPAQ